MEARATKLETVIQSDGVILFPGVKAGDKVEVIVLHQARPVPQTKPRLYGWLKGKIEILPGFDDPIPGMEEYR